MVCAVMIPVWSVPAAVSSGLIRHRHIVGRRLRIRWLDILIVIYHCVLFRYLSRPEASALVAAQIHPCMAGLRIFCNDKRTQEDPGHHTTADHKQQHKQQDRCHKAHPPGTLTLLLCRISATSVATGICRSAVCRDSQKPLCLPAHIKAGHRTNLYRTIRLRFRIRLCKLCIEPAL